MYFLIHPQGWINEKMAVHCLPWVEILGGYNVVCRCFFGFSSQNLHDGCWQKTSTTIFPHFIRTSPGIKSTLFWSQVLQRKTGRNWALSCSSICATERSHPWMRRGHWRLGQIRCLVLLWARSTMRGELRLTQSRLLNWGWETFSARSSGWSLPCSGWSGLLVSCHSEKVELSWAIQQI